MIENTKTFIKSFPKTYVIVRTDQYLSMLGVVVGGSMYAILDSKFFMWLTIVNVAFTAYTFIRDWGKPWAVISRDRTDKHSGEVHVDIHGEHPLQ